MEFDRFTKMIASFPLEDSNQLKRDEDVIYRFNDWRLTVGDVKAARLSLAVSRPSQNSEVK